MGEGGISAEAAPRVEPIKKAPLDAVVVCGMGPVKLANIKGSERLFPAQPYMRVNANAGKLIASNRLAETVIVSGTRTAEEVAFSEADVLADTYDRMRGKGISLEGRERASQILKLDLEAKTTFDNIIQALNMLDGQHGGYFEGSFAVLSAQFHMPRIEEMLKAFGLQDARALAAEPILRHFGYKGRLYPTGDFGYGTSYEDFEEGVYQSQPAGLQNLQDNPAYVTFELAKISSDRRFQQVARDLSDYYHSHGVEVPDFYAELPTLYDPNFDYQSLRAKYASIPFSKHAYTGSMSADDYRKLAATAAERTSTFLKEVVPIPPSLQAPRKPV